VALELPKSPDMANVCVIFEHVETDQDRSTFYNRECGYRFVKCGILRVVPGRNRAAFFLNLVLTALLCRARYRKRQISLVISGNPHIACALGIVHRLSRAKVKHVVWNFNAHRVYTGFQRSVARFALRDVDRIIVYSNHERHVYSAMLGLPLEKMVFKHYTGPYLEDERYTSLVPHKQDYVVSAGFSGRNYRHLAAVAEHLRDVPFLLLTYPEAVKELSFPPNVRILGGISEVEYCRHIANAKLFFLPLANKETANGHIAIVQAMVLRTLLVTNLTEGTKDYLLPGCNCLTYDEEDIPATAEMIRATLADDALRARIEGEAYRYAAERFTIQHEVEVLQGIVDRLMDAP
jgi:glycosyltransferase involved in cell wall biosynthesis